MDAQRRVKARTGIDPQSAGRTARRAAVASAVLIAALALAPPAPAATVRISAGTLSLADTSDSPELAYIRTAGGLLTVSDSAGAQAGPGCQQIAFESAQCPAAGVSAITVDLAGGDDHFDGGSVLGDGVLVPLTVTGGPGDDIIRGGRAADTINGGPGDDTLEQFRRCLECTWPVVGDDLAGGAGSDTVQYFDGDVTATLDGVRNDGIPTAPDLIRPDVENLSSFGFGDQTFTGNNGPNILDGGGLGSHDTLNGAGGDDVLQWGGTAHGGDGDDEIHQMMDSAHGDAGNDRLLTGEFNGGPGDYAGSLFGDGGDDTLVNAGSQNTNNTVMDGGPGFDRADFSRVEWPTHISLDGLTNDGFFTNRNLNVIAEQLVGGSGADVLAGGPGDDLLDGGPAPDVISGGPGDDRLQYAGRTTGVTVSQDGTAGDGGAEDAGGDNIASDIETLTGTPAADTLSGGPADNTLDGGAGDDILIGGAGDDLFLGGPGSDTASYRTTAQPVTVTLDSVADDGAAGEQDLVDPAASIENIQGGQGDDWLIGDDSANRLDGGPGDDILTGAGGPDTLTGGDGSDIADYADRTQPVAVDLDGATADDGQAGEHDSVSLDVEGVWGGAAADVLTGNAADNLLDGGPGADRLIGLGGFDLADYADRTAPVHVDLDGALSDDGETGEGDTLAADIEDIRGGAGDDTLIGDGTDNVLAGEGGADHLIGGAGPDGLLGGPGADGLNTRDADEDGASCGADADSILADELDFVDSDCESVDLGIVAQTPPAAPVPAPAPAAVPAPRAVPPGPDRTAPSARLSVARAPLGRVLRKGLRVTVRCSEACRIDARLVLPAKAAKRLKVPATVGRGVARARGPRATVTVVKFTGRARRRLARARAVSADLRVRITDPAGNTALVKRHVILRR